MSWRRTSETGLLAGMKVGSGVLLFLLQLVLARLLGPAGFGAYNFAMAGVNLLLVPVLFGFDIVVLRHVPVYVAQRDWGALTALLRGADRVVLTAAVIVAVPLAAVLGGADAGLEPILRSASLAALPLLPLLALVRVRRSTLQGLHRPISGFVPEMILIPALLVTALSLFLWLGPGRMEAHRALLLHALVAALGLVWVHVGCRRHLGPMRRSEAAPRPQWRLWFTRAGPMLMNILMISISSQVSILLLGLLLGAESTGAFAAAEKLSLVVGLMLGAVNGAFAARFSQLYDQEEEEALQREVTLGARLIIAAGVPSAVGIVALGPWLLSLFGPEYRVAYHALMILAGGQLFNVAAGPVGVLLLMTGHERHAAWGSAVGAGSNVVLNLLLIPLWGIEGGAAASAISMIVWNAILFGWVRSLTGLNPTAFPLLLRDGTIRR